MGRRCTARSSKTSPGCTAGFRANGCATHWTFRISPGRTVPPRSLPSERPGHALPDDRSRVCQETAADAPSRSQTTDLPPQLAHILAATCARSVIGSEPPDNQRYNVRPGTSPRARALTATRPQRQMRTGVWSCSNGHGLILKPCYGSRFPALKIPAAFRERCPVWTCSLRARRSWSKEFDDLRQADLGADAGRRRGTFAAVHGREIIAWFAQYYPKIK